MFSNEIWVPVNGFEGLYEVSNCGRVKSLPKAIVRDKNHRWGTLKQNTVTTKEKILKLYEQSCNNGKYKRHRVSLRKNGKTHYMRVSTLVLTAFSREAKQGEVCRHMDGNPLNNHLDNLSWGTCKDNTDDCIRHGTKTAPPVTYGENHHKSTLTSSQVEEIQSLTLKRGQMAFYARKYGVSSATIKRISTNVTRNNG